jgi:homoserine dehydrogenase
MKREVRLGLIGFGTVGKGVLRLFQKNRRRIESRIGARLIFARIADHHLDQESASAVEPGIRLCKAEEVVSDPGIEIVIELIGGLEPARSLVLKAIESGKAVVTANKALLSRHGDEIFQAAQENKVDIGFEASVGGGVPIIRTLKEALAADVPRGIYGIVNGTSNYILTKMSEEGGEFREVLRAAQENGFAEADPSLDVDGKDAAHKLSLLVWIAFRTRLQEEQIYTEGIRHISGLDVTYAKELGYRIKLLAIAKADGKSIDARVHPTMIPAGHMLADVRGVNNAIFVQSEALGSTLYFGQGAGMMPTATAVMADVMEIARNRALGIQQRVAPLGFSLEKRKKGLVVKGIRNLVTEYYLRFTVVDRPGVLSKIAGCLGSHGISIASVIQKGRSLSGGVPIVIRTHEAREESFRRALKRIDALNVIRARTVAIRMEELSS